MLGKPKYKYNDLVEFQFGSQKLVGNIYIIDKYGTLSDNSDVSYDIMVEHSPIDGAPCLYKHVQERYVSSYE